MADEGITDDTEDDTRDSPNIVDHILASIDDRLCDCGHVYDSHHYGWPHGRCIFCDCPYYKEPT